MKYITLLFVFLSFSAFSSTGVQKCGKYAFKGIPKIHDQNIIIVINEGTASEFQFIVPLSEHFKVTPYLKLTVEGEFNITKLHHLWKGEVKNLKKIKLSVPDPLNHKTDSFLNLKKSGSCL